MFRIRRIHDDVLAANRAAIERVQTMLRAQFPDAPERMVSSLPEQLRDPLTKKLRTVVFVAERRDELAGFAIVTHAPDLKFCFLDFITSSPDVKDRGIGGALYERIREEARSLETVGLFFECSPDDPFEPTDPAVQAQNQARMRFYERQGARPIIHTAYRTKVTPEDGEMPALMFDDLGTGRPLRRMEARAIVRAILERKYDWLCPPEYVERIVRSIKDNPVVQRAPRYGKPRPARSLPPPPDVRIPLVVNKKHEIHHVRERGYVEAPVRVAAIERELDKLSLFSPMEPRRFSRAHVSKVHDPDFLAYLERVCASLPPDRSVYPYVFPIRNQGRMPVDLEVRAGYYCIDTFTPLHRNAWLAAREAVGCALTAAAQLLVGSRLAYALVRPPGHHAERRVFGGFCYLNNAAIAAQFLSEHGTVAMLDIDYHHGNGQQDIFYRRSDVLTLSLHGHPSFAYPYFTGFEDERGEADGTGFNINMPLPEQVDGDAYARHLTRALGLIADFRPRFLVVCLGLDTGRGDPTGTFTLDSPDFERIGRLIGALGAPTVVVQEGGYHTKSLGAHARRFFRGLWEGSTGRVLRRAVPPSTAVRMLAPPLPKVT